MSLPTNPAARKAIPLATGFLDYFPDAVAAVATLSRIGNDQHNPGQSLRWDRSKSTDEADSMLRHFIQRGTLDVDGIRHSAKVAWRAMALLQKEIEAERAHTAREPYSTAVRRRPRGACYCDLTDEECYDRGHWTAAPKAGAIGAVSDYYDKLRAQQPFTIPWAPCVGDGLPPMQEQQRQRKEPLT